MPPRPLPADYKPSPQKPTIYSGPEVPDAYNPDWQHFTNLTPAQIAAFQAFPEWATKVADYNTFLQSKGMNSPFSAAQTNPSPVITTPPVVEATNVRTAHAMKKLLVFAALLLGCLPASAQEKATAIRCNAAAIYSTAVVGSTQLVGIPNTGAIYICGFTLGSSASATISAQLSYSTAGVYTTNNTGRAPVITGALQVPITPAFTVLSSTVAGVNDSSSAFRGLYVPAGNQLNLTTSVATGTMQAIVYYFQQQQ